MKERTAVPSDWEQMRILMRRNATGDFVTHRRLWFARTFGAPIFWAFYTIGFLLNDTGRLLSYDVFGDYRVYEPEVFSPPEILYLGRDAAIVTDDFYTGVQSQIEENFDIDLRGIAAEEPTLFAELCREELGDNAVLAKKVCVFMHGITNITVYYGGTEETLPFDKSLVGIQKAMQESILNALGDDTLFQIENIQRMPEIHSTSRSPAGIFYLIFPGVMLVLASAISMQFIMSPLTAEKKKGIVRSFALIGVKMRVYVHQWLIYMSVNALLTAGGLTLVAFAWKMFVESNPLLVFISFYLASIHMISIALCVTHYSSQTELSSGLPFMIAILSAILGAIILVFRGLKSIYLFLLAVLSPFGGMLQFTAIFVNWDRDGFGEGVQFATISESYLLRSIISQLLGIALCNALILWNVRPKTATSLAPNDDPQHDLPENRFETIHKGADVLLSAKGISHTFTKRSCRSTKNVEVLNDLDLNICRGEVFGYLGHNSSGKTTSIRLLSGELPLQQGTIQYNFTDGEANIITDVDSIRKRIGICPQHNDALHEDVSCRQFLTLFARLKGNLPQEPGQTEEEAIDAEVARRIQDIQFTSPGDEDKPIETYSGGMKRKVCIALAFLSDPEVVFLDEPSAGIDPYNRRLVWDMIIAAKAGRSIILTTHFLDEADILSDRVGILKDGHLVACGSTLFLKHQIGGYNLSYDGADEFNLPSLLEGAAACESGKSGTKKWQLQHGNEKTFPDMLRALEAAGAEDLSLELTSLEHVFLQAGKEDTHSTDSDDELDEDENGEVTEVDSDLMKQIWQRPASSSIKPLSEVGKLLLVTRFMFGNALRMKGTIFLNIIQPMIYVLVGFLIVAKIDDITETGESRELEAIPITPALALAERDAIRFFGFGAIGNTTEGDKSIQLLDTPQSLEDYFETGPFLTGYMSSNQTLQYNATESLFALQIGLQLFGGSTEPFEVWLQQFPYVTQAFRTDVLLLPMMMVFGFSGVIFSVLDLLNLKADNIVSQFRVTGISELTAYLGVLLYKVLSTFLPFFVLVIVLGYATSSTLFGNGGRWLAAIMTMLLYVYSTAPLGALIAKKFITKDFKAAATIFPGIYLTTVSLPYIAWNIAFQVATDARQALLVVGDILTIVPPVAFQRGVGSVLEVSAIADDPSLTWETVWNFENRVWLSSLIMFIVGTLEWYYLFRLTALRPSPTKLGPVDSSKPSNCPTNFGVEAEKVRSCQDDQGINARELVKLFRVKPEKGSESQEAYIKAAVRGVSFGVKHNSILAVVGPNGAGKSTAMGVLAADHTPEHGSLALEKKALGMLDKRSDQLFRDGTIAYCPQFDALFPKKSVLEHLHFYAKVRGLNPSDEATQKHISAIVRLLGLGNHLNKLSTAISGGYKRRTCLAIAMIGYPAMMMIDECTTGLDPGARHLAWRVLKAEAEDGVEIPAILLSTHYMDEASKLGDRVAIFIDGEMASVGSLSELRSEYCKSYFVEISLLPNVDGHSQQRILKVMSEHGMSSHVYESLPLRFKIQVPFDGNSPIRQLSDIFELLDTQRESLGIQFFSVTQMSLEQIFIDLSRRQFSPKMDENSGAVTGSPTKSRGIISNSVAVDNPVGTSEDESSEAIDRLDI